jgi:hypothetical protein
MGFFAPEVGELLDLIGSPEIKGVVAKELSCLMLPKGFVDVAIRQALADNETPLYLPDGEHDFTSESGRLALFDDEAL